MHAPKKCIVTFTSYASCDCSRIFRKRIVVYLAYISLNNMNGIFLRSIERLQCQLRYAEEILTRRSQEFHKTTTRSQLPTDPIHQSFRKESIHQYILPHASHSAVTSSITNSSPPKVTPITASFATS
uniref:Uncharacterized protein n=1 Tax=Leptocylindrus danicus TaxID=163516 RepID=A0A7S2PR93_9STRA